VATVVRSGTDWIRVIEVLDFRIYLVVTSPYYGDATDDGTAAGQNGRKYKSQPRRFAGKDGSQNRLE
jgi:hypothetical protein